MNIGMMEGQFVNCEGYRESSLLLRLLIVLLVIPLLAGSSLAQQGLSSEIGDRLKSLEFGTVSIHNNETLPILDGSCTVTYRSSGYGQSMLQFTGLKGVSFSADGPFTQTKTQFDRGDVIYVCTLSNKISSFEVIQEVQKVATLEFELTNPPEGSPIASWLRCREMGRQDGSAIETGGSFGGGLVGGFLLGLVGTGIAYYSQGEPEPRAITLLNLEDQECMYGYVSGFRQSGKAKKQSAALKGGLLGTAIIVALVFSASSGN